MECQKEGISLFLPEITNSKDIAKYMKFFIYEFNYFRMSYLSELNSTKNTLGFQGTF